MTTDDIDIDDEGAAAPSPEDLVAAHEAQLNDLLLDVRSADGTVEPDEPVSMNLAGLDVGRRDFMKAGAAVGAASALAGCTSFGSQLTPAGGSGGSGSGSGSGHSHSVAPGDHDTYYGFWSAGQTGEVRVIGIPSMRELMRIPVFSKESARGHFHDDETKAMLEESGGSDWGDSHHPNLSETDGKYDGRWLFINDKANGRVARISLKYFETDRMVNIPNVQAVHGLCVQSPDTEYVFANSEFRIPLPNDGRDVDDHSKWGSVLSALDPETLDVRWQVRVDGNLDIVDSDKDGRWVISSAYNDEEGVEIEEMTHDDRDFVKAFDVPAIQELVDGGAGEEIDGVTVIDGRQDSQHNAGDDPIVRYIPTPKSPHCVEVTPDGKYAIVAGKLSPTVSIIDIDKLATEPDPAKTIVGQPKLGLGPLHTTYDGRGHGYTSLFIDSQVVKWDIEAAVNAPKGSEEPILGKIDVHYNPGHIQAVQAMSTEPTGDWLVVLNKLSKDRFLPVGPIHPDNDQLIWIGDDEDNETGGMELVADEPVYPEPHDAVMAHRDKLDPSLVYDKADYEGEKEYITEGDSGVERLDDSTVHVKMSAKRSEFGLREFRVKEGDEVRMTVTNIEGIRDIIHGVAVPEYGIHLAVAPQDTREATFVADEPGVYWIYCTYFCSALHLEMRSRMIVEPN